MALNNTLQILGIGAVTINTSKRARRLSIRVKPFKGIEVGVPYGTPVAVVDQFLQTHHQWMIDALAKSKARENKRTIFNEHTQFKSLTFALSVEAAPINVVRLKKSKDLLRVFYPQHIDVNEPIIQATIRRGLEEVLRNEAKLYLPIRTGELASMNNFKYSSLFIKNLKSRWGSCSSVNNINLNLHLMRLPKHLIDYVILHELCHTKEKNHGKGFWNLMAQITNGMASQWDKEMKKYQTTIY